MHTPERELARDDAWRLSPDKKEELYAMLASTIKHHDAGHLKECNCMKAYYRNLFATPNNTAHYVFDEKDGYLWVRGDEKIREAHSKTPVSIDIYDVTALGKSGSYRHLATIKVEPTSEQIDKGINFINDLDRKTSQSPFDVEKELNP